MNVGRPSKYDKKYCEEIVEFMKNGASIVEFAVHIGVSKDTIYEWCKVHKDFSDAKKRAVEASESWWTRTGREGLYFHPKDTQLNATLWYMNMKNRFKWSDKQEQKIEQTQEVKIIRHNKLEKPE